MLDMKKRIRALIAEKDQLRGMVPSRAFGIKDKVYGEYLTKLNPREDPKVQHALSITPDPRFQEFLDRIKLPQYKRVSLQSIAKACDISLLEFTQWWSKVSTQVAIHKAQTESIKITEDMIEDARSREVACERCDGMTWVSAPPGLPKTTPGYRKITNDDEELWIRDCPVCSNGKIRKPGDAHARDRILEMSGLVQKGKAAVQIVQNFGGAAHSSAVTQLDAITIDVIDQD